MTQVLPPSGETWNVQPLLATKALVRTKKSTVPETAPLALIGLVSVAIVSVELDVPAANSSPLPDAVMVDVTAVMVPLAVNCVPLGSMLTTRGMSTLDVTPVSLMPTARPAVLAH